MLCKGEAVSVREMIPATSAALKNDAKSDTVSPIKHPRGPHFQDFQDFQGAHAHTLSESPPRNDKEYCAKMTGPRKSVVSCRFRS